MSLPSLSAGPTPRPPAVKVLVSFPVMTSHASPLRVLMVTPRYLPFTGGVELHVHEVARRLARRGASVTILTTDPSGALPSKESVEGVEVRRVRAHPANRDYHFAPGIRAEVSRREWDVVHVQSYHTFVAPLTMHAARRAGHPYVVTFHAGGHSSAFRHRLRPLQLAALRPFLAERLSTGRARRASRRTVTRSSCACLATGSR